MSRKIHEERLWGRNRKQPIDQAFDRPCQAVYRLAGNQIIKRFLAKNRLSHFMTTQSIS